MFFEKGHVTVGAEPAGIVTYFRDYRSAKVQMWDTSGQDRYNGRGRSFYKSMHCYVLVFDVNSAKSFDALDKLIDDFVVEVLEADVRRWCQSRGNVRYYETSAKDGINVSSALIDAILIVWNTFSRQRTTMDEDEFPLMKRFFNERGESSCS